jgi:hypothetical protein
METCVKRKKLRFLGISFKAGFTIYFMYLNSHKHSATTCFLKKGIFFLFLMESPSLESGYCLYGAYHICIDIIYSNALRSHHPINEMQLPCKNIYHSILRL